MSPRTHQDAAGAVQRALALLGAASADWRQRGPSDGSTPLHWPIAVKAARAHLEHALAQMEADPGQIAVALSEAAQRLRGWSAGAGPDGRLIQRIETLLAEPPCPDCGSTDEGHAAPCDGRRVKSGPYRTALRAD